MTRPMHLWYVVAHGDELWSVLPTSPVLARVSAHRRRRGAYSAANPLLRELVPVALERWNDLVTAHDIEILSAAPELAEVLPASRETLASLAIPTEHTRFHSPARVERLGHGLVDFLLEHVRRLGRGPYLVVVDDLDEADNTDLAFVAALCRRADPRLLRVIVTSRRRELPASLDGLVAERHVASSSTYAGGSAYAASGDPAESYVMADGILNDPRAEQVYAALSPARRRLLHDERAAELGRCDDRSLGRGAMIWHLERGSRPEVRAVEALLAALRFNLDHGFYEAAIECGKRLRALTTWDASPDVKSCVVAQMGMALMVLGRLDEVRDLFEEGRRNSADPTMHLQICYGYAMLATRYSTGSGRDHDSARAWINTALALCASWPDPEERAFLTVFHQNALALVEVHLGHLEDALRLVSEGLRQLDQELPVGMHQLHRSVLRYNQAQVYAALGNNVAAIEAYGLVIDDDPCHPDYYFERGGLLRKAGLLEEAVADYTAALRCSPPLAEAHYNRADVLIEMGQVEQAFVDLDRVIDLDPRIIDAYANRASLHIDAGRLREASVDIEAGLQRDPKHALLNCLKAVIGATEGRLTEAVESFDRSLSSNPSLVEARAGRASAWYELGRPDLAAADLDAVLADHVDGSLFFNRGLARHDLGQFEDSVADYTTALAHLGPDGEVLYRRALSLIALNRPDEAREDLRAARGTYEGVAAAAKLLSSWNADAAGA